MHAATSCSTKAPRQSIAFHASRDGALLYDEDAQRVFTLNETATFCWQHLGKPDASIALEQAFGIDSQTAEQWWQACLDGFAAQGLTGDAAPIAKADNISTTAPVAIEETVIGASIFIRLLGQNFTIVVPDGVEAYLEGLLRPCRVTRHDPSSGSTISIRTAGTTYDVLTEGRVTSRNHALSEVATAVEAALIEIALNRCKHLLTLHSACLRRGDNGLLLAASSGSGKSTMSAALAKAGWDYGSDELTLLARDFSAHPVSLGPCIKSGSIALVERLFPGFANVPEQSRYGRKVRFLALDAGFEKTFVRAVVFPTHSPDAETEILPVRGWAGLNGLLEGCVFVPAGFTAADLPGLAKWHDSVDYYEVTFGKAEKVAEKLGALLESRERPWLNVEVPE